MDSDPRADEKRRRESAQTSDPSVEPGGSEVERRSIKQMVSVRLEAQLLKELRLIASERGVSISDLLREAAIDLVERARPTRVYVALRSVGMSQVIHGEVSAALSATSGVAIANETGQAAVSAGGGDFKICV